MESEQDRRVFGEKFVGDGEIVEYPDGSLLDPESRLLSWYDPVAEAVKLGTTLEAIEADEDLREARELLGLK